MNFRSIYLSLFSCLLFLAPVSMQAQTLTQTLRGTIRDADSKKPLEGAKVVLFDKEVVGGDYSDAEGRFKIEKVPIGRYNLQVSYIGYEEGSQSNIIINSGKEVVLNVSLTEKIITTDGIEINAQSESEARNEMTTVSARQFSIDETRRYAGAWNDPARMASNFAGVNNQDDTRNDIVIRGNSPAGVLWRLDGVDIPNPNHFGTFGTTGGPVSILNNNVLDNSDFMTGAFPAEYGNALAGAFDLRMRKGNDEKYEFLGQVGFNGLEFNAEGPLKKGSGASFIASYRYSSLAWFQALGINFGSSSQPTYQDASFKVFLPTKKAGRFSLFALGGLSAVEILDSERDSTDFFGPSGNDIVLGSKMGAVGLTHQIFIGKNTFIRNIVSATASELFTSVDNIDRDTKFPTAFYRNESTQDKLNYSFLINSKLSTRQTLRAGAFIDRIGFNLQDSVQIDTTFGWNTLTNIQGDAFLIRPYVSHKYRINEFLTLNSGLYYQYFTRNNTQSLEPRVGLRWNMSDKASMSAAVGIHSQLQPTFVYFAQALAPDGSPTLPNQNLDFTKARHYVLAYDQTLAPSLRLKVETYYQQLYDVPVDIREENSFTMLDQGADYFFIIPDSLGNEGTGRNYGVDFTLEKFFSKQYYFLVTASLFDSKYTGSDGIQRSTIFDGRYTFVALTGAEFKLGKRKNLLLGADIRVKLSGGRRYTPLDEAATLATQQPVYLTEEANSLQHPDYFRTDLRIKFRINSKRISQEIALDTSNIFNTQNVLNIVYDYSANALRTNYQLGFFPVGQYKIEF